MKGVRSLNKPLCASIAWEGQILRFTSPDTGQDRWNFADGEPSRADEALLCAQLTLNPCTRDSVRPSLRGSELGNSKAKGSS